MTTIRPMTAADIPQVERITDEALAAWLRQTREAEPGQIERYLIPVSYTHLTLPTILRV